MMIIKKTVQEIGCDTSCPFWARPAITSRHYFKTSSIITSATLGCEVGGSMTSRQPVQRRRRKQKITKASAAQKEQQSGCSCQFIPFPSQSMRT